MTGFLLVELSLPRRKNLLRKIFGTQLKDTSFGALIQIEQHLGYRKIWVERGLFDLRTGIKHKKHFIPTQRIVNQLSTTMCQFLPAVHALIGCDSNSSFRTHSKKSAFKVLNLCEESNIGLNPSHMSNSAFVLCKTFVCRVYDSKTSIEDLNVLRYGMFTKSHTSSDKLPTYRGFPETTHNACQLPIIHLAYC